MIYTHVLNRGGRGVKSPIDRRPEVGVNGGHAEGSGPIRCLILALVAPTSPDRVAGLPLAAIGSSDATALGCGLAAV